MVGVRTSIFTVRVLVWRRTDEYYVQVDSASHFRLPLGCWSVGFITCLCSGFICFGTWFWGLFRSGLVSLGLLVVLFCGLLIGLARLAFCRTGFGCLSLLCRQFCPLGVNCWFWRVWPCWQQSWVRKSWTGGVGRFLGFLGFGVWLPCMLAWWGLLSLSGFDARLVIKSARAPGGKIRAKV